MDMVRVLVLDKDPLAGEFYSGELKVGGHCTWHAETTLDALRVLAEIDIDVMISDASIEGWKDGDLIEKVALTSPNTEIVLVADEDSYDIAKTAMVAGIHDFIEGIPTGTELRAIVAGATSVCRLRSPLHSTDSLYHLQNSAMELAYGRCDHGQPNKGSCIQCSMEMLSKVTNQEKERMRELAALESDCFEDKVDNNEWPEAIADRIRRLN
jgi:DNA-binding NarL/FixJ family response regulator